MKKWLSFLALAILPFATAQANTLPNVLAGLDNASNLEVMNDQQLSEVRGTGNLPNDFALRDYYYNYNNYGATGDFRSYIYDGGSTYSGGIDLGSGGIVGERWYVNIYGSQQLAEARTLYVQQESTGYVPYLYQSDSGWNRVWDGYYHYHQNYNYVIN